VPELRNRPRIIAHRGMSSLAPENTLSAFRLCAAHGVSWFEFDCDVLADGTAVVIHDATLDRTTNQTGDYRALATADLAGIDAGSWFGAGFAGELELLDPDRELLVSSFNPLLLAEFHRTAPRWPIACLYENHQFAAVWRSVAGLRGRRRSTRASRASNGTACAGSVPRATTSTSGRSTRWSRRRSSPRPGAEKGPTRRAPTPGCEGPSG